MIVFFSNSISMKSINDGTINRDKQITSLTPAEKTAGFFVAREALYMVRSLDLNRPFAEIADSLDRIAYESFGNMLKRSA